MVGLVVVLALPLLIPLGFGVVLALGMIQNAQHAAWRRGR